MKKRKHQKRININALLRMIRSTKCGLIDYYLRQTAPARRKSRPPSMRSWHSSSQTPSPSVGLWQRSKEGVFLFCFFRRGYLLSRNPNVEWVRFHGFMDRAHGQTAPTAFWHCSPLVLASWVAHRSKQHLEKQNYYWPLNF